MDLENYRADIDSIDTQITELFVERMKISGQLAQYKKENGIPILNSVRERQVLARISKIAGDGFDSYARILFSTLFDISRSYQSMLTNDPSPIAGRISAALSNTETRFPSSAVVACQGVEGAYSQQACDSIFSFADIVYFKTYEGVFGAVEKGLCRYGVLPIENSSHGSVNVVYDLMRGHDFHIVGSKKLHINHCLLAKKGTRLSDVKEILSHEQALGQCSEFLATLPGVKVTVCENTAAAAKAVAESGRNDAATISSRNCASLYGLEILSDRIHNTDNNYTRFIVISKNLEIYPGASKISLMFSVSNTPGSLIRLLSRFSSLGLNMTKLESRPVPGTDFSYLFYMDVDASIYAPEVIKLLCELEHELDYFTFLGSYSEM